ncbi:hypothetical protein PWR63_20160 [Paraburkholderia sp. A2WS-5]|uniref:hypothetical protein n=1 Tax=unclassified Paraburkholderia TaxID=2615204 RepID=UPI003B7E28A6
MSNTIEVTQPNSSYTIDGTTFEVDSGASMNLTGSSNEIRVSNGAGSVAIWGGAGNTIFAGDHSNVTDWGDRDTATIGNNSSVSIGGNGDNVTLGTNSSVNIAYYGNNDTVTVGANTTVAVNGTNATINAVAGGGTIDVCRDRYNIDFCYGNTMTFNANNYNILLEELVANVNGNGNQITLNADNTANVNGKSVLNLSGSNNTVAFNAQTPNGNPLSITTSSGDYVTEDATGAIWFSDSWQTMSMRNGLVTIGFADGNHVAISGIKFTSDGNSVVADNQTNQLVAAMAAYSNGVSGLSVHSSTQMVTDASLFASAQH